MEAMDTAEVAISTRRGTEKCRSRSKLVERECCGCLRKCQYKYYGAFACEACKQFFRRIILKGGPPSKCMRGSECIASSEDENCNSCRLDRCLLGGMDPRLVNNIRTDNSGAENFYRELEVRRNKIIRKFYGKSAKKERVEVEKEMAETLEIEPPIFTKEIAKELSLQKMAIYEENFFQIWLCEKFMPDKYISRHGRLEQFLRDRNNILGMGRQFFIEASPPEFLYLPVESRFVEQIRFAIKDRFLYIELIKLMPFFDQLEYNDQIAHLRHIVTPIAMLFNTFYSILIGEETWSRSNGFKYMSNISERCPGDQKISTWCRQLYCDPVQSFKHVGLARDEFPLLLAIFMSSPTATGLSDSARELLYAESAASSKALLQMLIRKYGISSGPQKFAQSLHLLTLAFHFDDKVHLMREYMEVFYSRPSCKKIFPRVFWGTPLEEV